MEFYNGVRSAQDTNKNAIPRFPCMWIGYALGAATIFAEIVAVLHHPETTKLPLVVPPLYLFLPSFICLVYWLVCAYEYHVVLSYVTSGGYPIRASRAAWFHLIPIYGFYWAFQWPREFARFVNSNFTSPLMNPDRTGLSIFTGFLIFILFDRGFGMLLLFAGAANLSAGLRRAIEQASRSDLPFS